MDKKNDDDYTVIDVSKITEPKKKKKKKRRSGSMETELGLFCIFLAFIIIVLWPFITITVAAGHVGVYYSVLFGGTVIDKTYGEGLRFKLPWDDIVIYDARALSKDYSITALTKGGLSVEVDMSIIWVIRKERAGELHSRMGDLYPQNVINPSVVSAVRSVIGSLGQEELYDGNPLMLQEEVTKLLTETLKTAPFDIHTILIREVRLPSKMAASISDKFVSEQSVLSERYNVLRAVESFKRQYVEAKTVQVTQNLVNSGMSEPYLRYLGILATQALANSENAKLVIIGDKDGLPLILNPDTLPDTMPVLPSASETENTGDNVPPVEVNRSELAEEYAKLQSGLDRFTDIFDEASREFPHAEQRTGDQTTIPQTSVVPVVPQNNLD